MTTTTSPARTPSNDIPRLRRGVSLIVGMDDQPMLFAIKLIVNIKELIFYPILKKLEQNDCLTTYSQEYQGRKRKYYSLTAYGHEHLLTLKEEWQTYTMTISGSHAALAADLPASERKCSRLRR